MKSKVTFFAIIGKKEYKIVFSCSHWLIEYYKCSILGNKVKIKADEPECVFEFLEDMSNKSWTNFFGFAIQGDTLVVTYRTPIKQIDVFNSRREVDAMDDYDSVMITGRVKSNWRWVGSVYQNLSSFN